MNFTAAAEKGSELSFEQIHSPTQHVKLPHLKEVEKTRYFANMDKTQSQENSMTYL